MRFLLKFSLPILKKCEIIEIETVPRRLLLMDEKALYKITYGLYVVSAQADGQRGGCVVNTLQQVTA